MNRLTTWLGLAVAALLVLVAVLTALMYLAVDEQKIKTSVAAIAARQFGAELRIDGELVLAVLPSPTLLVAGIGLRLNDEVDGDLATVDRVRFGVRLLPLLRGELAFDEASIEGLNVRAVREADGRTNWERRTATADTAPADPAGSGEGTAAATLAIARLRVNNSTLSYEDRASGAVSRMELASLNADGFNLGNSAFDLAAQGRLVSGSGEQQDSTDFSLGASAAVDAAAERISLSDAKLELTPAEGDALSLQAVTLVAERSGTLGIRQASLSRGELALTGIDAQLLQEQGVTVLRSLVATVYDGKLEASGRSDPRGEGTLSIEAKLAGTDIRALLRALGQPERMDGRLEGTLNLTATGSSAAERKGSLAGPVSLRVQDPVLHEVSVEQIICKAAATLNREVLSAQFEPFTRLDGLEAALDFRAGVGEFRTLSATMPNMALAGEGRIDLPQRKLKIHVDTRITRDLSDRDPACRMTNKMLRVEWPITCRGSFDEDPKQWCGIDSDDLSKIAAQAATEKLGDKIRDKLRDFFGND